MVGSNPKYRASPPITPAIILFDFDRLSLSVSIFSPVVTARSRRIESKIPAPEHSAWPMHPETESTDCPSRHTVVSSPGHGQRGVCPPPGLQPSAGNVPH